MATTGVGFRESFKANADLDTKQWYFVKAGSIAGEVAVGTGGSNKGILGVLENDPNVGEEATVCMFGVTKVTASAAIDGATGAASAISFGDLLTCGSNGKAYKCGTSALAAIALEALSSATGGVIRVWVVGPGMSVIALN